MNLVQNSFAQLEISYPNLLHNYNYFRSKLKSTTKLLILIKANSYGHGAIEFADAMEQAGVDYFAVAHPIEGIELRRGGIIQTPIMILTAGNDYFKDITEYELEPAVPNIENLLAFNEYLKKHHINKYPIHINLDTGMHRLGFMEKELPVLLNFLQQADNHMYIKSLFTHLAASDEPQHDAFTREQVALYHKLADAIISVLGYSPMRHVLNSAGIERFPQYQMDMVRLGIGIYGISAVEELLLKPAAALTCDILQIKTLTSADGTVGYGRHGKLEGGERKIATLPLGYADGINRHLGCGNAKFMLNGHLVPSIGNICMDMFMIDVTGVDAKIGDTVTIFGEKPTARELAKILDTIPYEIFTSVSRRVKRIVR
ncbi:MAG: alanine racemase [Bacteroidales bacterium]